MKSIHLRASCSATLLILCACRNDKPETLIREAFRTSVKNIEAGDAAGAVEILDSSFHGPDGLDKPSARLFLMGLFRQGKVGLSVVQDRIRVEGDRAFQEVELLLTQKSSGPLPDEMSKRDFLLHWEKRKDKWLLREVQSTSP
jgi:ketosteroid isomerase-like protein